MASSSTGMYVPVDFHYNGFFSPNPLVYLDPVKTNVRDVDFGGFTYKEFLLWLTKLTNGECDNVYYCMRKESLCEGIRRIDSDADYWEFVETVYSLESDSLESELDVYIDHRNEPILDWADNEFLEDGKGYELDEEDDKDSEVSMKMEYEHEWDDEDEHTFDKTVRDPFLDKLSGHISDDDEEEANNGKLKDVVFPVHNENQEWEQMVPVLGMKFSNPLELKLCITNYAVKNGYDLWYEKSDHERGQLLSAIGRDANNHIYPIAWAVVSVESKETWKWFINLLIEDLGMGVGHGLTLISDQHKGLLEAVKERVPAAEHRQCARHICANFLKRFKGQVFRKLFWYAAAATTPAKFEQHMNEIKKLEPLAYDHLMERDPKTWSKAFFQTDRACDAYENGISESFNSVIEVARKRPLITMLEEIRIYVMERLYRQKIKGQSWDLTICPTIRLKLSKLKDLQRTCACRTWQLTGYPCVHGYACIASLNRDVQEYVSPWFTTSMYLNCYRNTINPLNGSDMWPHVDYISPLPPKRRRLPGRPSTKRKRDQIERENQGKKHSITKRGSVMKCSICRESGHNRTTCPQKPIGESSNASSKKKKSKKADKVKVVLAHEVDIDSDSEVEIEPESDVDSFDLEFEDDVQPEVEDGVEPEVQDGVQHEVQDEVQAEVEPENHPEVHDANQVEVHLAVQAEVEPEVQVQVEDANQIVVQDQVEIPAFQVVVGKRARKPSERITKLKIRKMWEGKQGSSDDNPYELD
ncbi:unnamed protein product [Lactuca saligna]|uniref:SWIM-type domain-containing protein n=1 Tax=Lactuca saligna TaxID=75948 RepID=A0AA35YLL2_LACSI|nr:unnamed protein product [Lactuca saligna]